MSDKSYPRTRFEIIDQSTDMEISTVSVGTPGVLYMATYTSDKGPEDWEILYGLDSFTGNKGALNFGRHGLPQLTVAQMLRSGAYVFAKRLVSADATLANVSIHARVRIVDGVSYVYFYADSVADHNGNFDELCEKVLGDFDYYAEGTPITVEDDAVGDDAETTTTEEGETVVESPVEDGTETTPTSQAVEYDIPILTVAAIGRGIANVKFNIELNSYASKSRVYPIYNIKISDRSTNEVLETFTFSMLPDVIINNTSQAIESKINGVSNEIVVRQYEEATAKLIELLAETAIADVDKETGKITYMGADELAKFDFMNGTTVRGNDNIGGIMTIETATPYIVDPTDDKKEIENSADPWVQQKPADITPVSFQSTFVLINGSYGEMGSAPIKNPKEYEKLLLGAFGANGPYDPQFFPQIYDLDNYKLDAIFDCDYPWSVKRAIQNFVDYRDDLVYFADMGTTLKTYDEIMDGVERYSATNEIKGFESSRNTIIFHNYCKIIDPFSHKRITVTLPFLLINRVTEHIVNKIANPVAGFANSFYFPEIINNTINFLPMNTPVFDVSGDSSGDQKQDFANKNINYISYYDGVPVLETMYTNQDAKSKLSYASNVMTLQNIVKVIRHRCPRSRYSFMTSAEINEYIEDIETVLNDYRSNFDTLTMQYMADPTYEDNNIFYATLVVKFKNFVQEEYFKVLVIS